LLERIAACGAVVSQFPIGTPPDAFRFPSRNFVIAALARAVIVVEAPLKSGALITAVAAVDEGRHVFVCPAPMDAESHHGGFALVNEGASLLYDLNQVFEALGVRSQGKKETEDERLPELQQQILAMIGGVPVLADAISDALDLPSGQVLAELTQLELLGKVARLGGGYVRA
jgi:DNA processing protein